MESVFVFNLHIMEKMSGAFKLTSLFGNEKGIKLPIPILALLTKHLINGSKGFILTPRNQTLLYDIFRSNIQHERKYWLNLSNS